MEAEIAAYLKGSLCEQSAKKGGTTSIRPRPFIGRGFFVFRCVLQSDKTVDDKSISEAGEALRRCAEAGTVIP